MAGNHLHKNAAIIIIGNEILSGKVTDINTPFLANELFKLGIRLKRVVIIPDTVEDIADEIKYCKGRYHFIFTSGGMGPTHDDVTLEGLAKGINRKLLSDPVLEKCIESYYKEPTDIHFRLAMVPEGTTILLDEKLVMPVIHFENIYVFPGIPKLLQKQFNFLKDRFQGEPIHHLVLDLNVEEVRIARFLEELLKEFPGVEIGSYPVIEDKKFYVHLTFCSRNLESCGCAKEKLLSMVSDEWLI